MSDFGGDILESCATPHGRKKRRRRKQKNPRRRKLAKREEEERRVRKEIEKAKAAELHAELIAKFGKKPRILCEGKQFRSPSKARRGRNCRVPNVDFVRANPAVSKKPVVRRLIKNCFAAIKELPDFSDQIPQAVEEEEEEELVLERAWEGNPLPEINGRHPEPPTPPSRTGAPDSPARVNYPLSALRRVGSRAFERAHLPFNNPFIESDEELPPEAFELNSQALSIDLDRGFIEVDAGCNPPGPSAVLVVPDALALGGAGGLPPVDDGLFDNSVEILCEIETNTRVQDLSVEIIDEVYGSILLTSYEEELDSSGGDGTDGVQIYGRGGRGPPG